MDQAEALLWLDEIDELLDAAGNASQAFHGPPFPGSGWHSPSGNVEGYRLLLWDSDGDAEAPSWHEQLPGFRAKSGQLVGGELDRWHVHFRAWGNHHYLWTDSWNWALKSWPRVADPLGSGPELVTAVNQLQAQLRVFDRLLAADRRAERRAAHLLGG